MVNPSPQSKQQAMRLVKIAAAMNNYGKLSALIGPEKAQRYFDEQREVADCRRRAACNPKLLDMRLD